MQLPLANRTSQHINVFVSFVIHVTLLYNLFMDIAHLIENTLYFLALINPASKILFLTSKTPAYTTREIVSISLRSSLVALLILILLTSTGNFILLNIFHVEIYSLSVAGGVILFIIGLSAVKGGSFYEKGDLGPNKDVSIVPLAAPLIAGPGVMTAALSYSSMHGSIETLTCITIAIVINMLCMLMSLQIGRTLERFHITGPLIRITGLIVTAVAAQMVFSGLSMWMNKSI
jgi:multiple antibiotic resistance protein